MLPTDRSHEKKPYYAMVKYYNSDAVLNGQLRCITAIPNRWELEMHVGHNWEYHRDRMEIVGDIVEFGHLLYNQNFQYKP